MELIVKDINKSFTGKHILKGINIEAKSGRAVGLLGRNGAGKTTSIRIIMNVFMPDSGEVLIDGKPLKKQNIRIGYLPEERGLYPKKKIIDQIVYLSQLKGMDKKEAIKSADYWLKRLSMDEYRNKLLETLSKGNQQKIQLAATIACNPDIVILDEPFSGLDPVNAMLLKDIVKELIASGKIVIFSSHQMNYIEEFCDDIVIIQDGTVALSGNIKEIIKSYPRDCLKVTSADNHDIYTNEDYKMEIVNDELLIYLESESIRQEVMMKLCQKYDIDGIQIKEPTLNDIFVEYTTKGEQ